MMVQPSVQITLRDRAERERFYTDPRYVAVRARRIGACGAPPRAVPGPQGQPPSSTAHPGEVASAHCWAASWSRPGYVR